MYKLTQLADLVEQRGRYDQSDGIVPPDPLLLDMELQWKLGELRAKGVRELHGTAHRLSGGVRHVDAAFVLRFEEATINYSD